MSGSSDIALTISERAGRHPRLVLDHLTAAEVAPDRLAELAAETGFMAIAPFLHGMPGTLPLPDYDLVQDAGYRRSLRCHLRELGVAIDLVYPFTLARHIAADHYLPALEAAAELGAVAVNVLSYDRDPSRRQDQFCRLVELAGGYDLAVALEFYPPSRVADIESALTLVEGAGTANQAGITLDLLHLYRSGLQPGDLQERHRERIMFVQLCDGPAERDRGELDFEAAFDRLLPGEGRFDFGPLAAIPSSIPVTVEVPRDAARMAGETPLDRVRRSMAATLEVMGFERA